jgi:hypothetical protein
MGKGPRAVVPRAGVWACLYICLKSKPFDCPAFAGVIFDPYLCACGRGCGW